MPSSLERKFDLMWERLHPGIDLDTEVGLITGRKFKFDYVHHDSKVAIELNGQIWQKAGHSSGTGLLRDYEKLNLAQMQGYCVFQLAGKMITESWLEAIANTIAARTLEANFGDH